MGSNRGITTITSAPRPLADDIAARRRNYLIAMSIRMACFIGAILVTSWLRWVLAVGAIVLPYIAVVIANAGREKAEAPAARFVARELPPGSAPSDLEPQVDPFAEAHDADAARGTADRQAGSRTNDHTGDRTGHPTDHCAGDRTGDPTADHAGHDTGNEPESKEP